MTFDLWPDFQGHVKRNLRSVPFQRLKLANFDVFAGDMDMDRCWEMGGGIHGLQWHCDLSEVNRGYQRSRHASVISYADDSQIIHSARPTPSDLAELRLTVEADLTELSSWFTSNGLKVNPSKTELMLFGTAPSLKKAADFSISFDGVNLKPGQNIKILGVVLDPELSMKQQVSNVTKRCYGSLLTINKLRDTLPRRTLVHLIQSLVFTHITYCLPAWAPPTQQQRHRIDKVINLATRIVTKKRRHSRPHHRRKTRARVDVFRRFDRLPRLGADARDSTPGPGTAAPGSADKIPSRRIGARDACIHCRAVGDLPLPPGGN